MQTRYPRPHESIIEIEFYLLLVRGRGGLRIRSAVIFKNSSWEAELVQKAHEHLVTRCNQI